jgi:CRP-like cAMP-binding protein
MTNQLIKEIRIIADLSDDDIQLLKSSMEEKFFSKGEHFLFEGQINKHIGYIHRGLMMYYKIVEGTEIPADFAEENEWVGYLKSFSTDNPSDMFIRAVEDTSLYAISKNSMLELIQRQPKFMVLKSYYTERSFVRNVEHASNLATLDAKQRYLQFMKTHPNLFNRIPQYHIAAYLGIKPQSLSRIRSKDNN